MFRNMQIHMQEKSDITFADQTWTTGNSAEEHLAPAPDDSYYQAVFNNVDIPLQNYAMVGTFYFRMEI